MGTFPVRALRVVIVLLLAGSVIFQGVMLPLLFSDMADLKPEFEHLRYAVPLLLFLGMVCAQVILVSVWRLLTLVRSGAVFSPTSFTYVDRVIAAILAAAVLVFAFACVLAPGEAAAPGVVLIVCGLSVAVLGVALVVVVLRMLLVQATGFRAELDEVI